MLTGLARRTIPDVRAVAVAVPEDLDKLMDALAGPETWNASSPTHQGEHLYTSERVIVSPSAGVFEPDVELAALETTALAAATAAPGSGEGTAPGSRPGRRRPGRDGGDDHRGPDPVRGHSHPVAGRARASGWSRVSRWRGSAPPGTGRDGGGLVTAVAVTGWGGALPPTTVTNDELAERLDTDDAWIVERTGIRERRVGGSVGELSVEAGKAALQSAGIEPSSVDMLVAGHHDPRPGHARHLGPGPRRAGPGGGAFDLNAACSGFVYSLFVGYSMVRSGRGATGSS